MRLSDTRDFMHYKIWTLNVERTKKIFLYSISSKIEFAFRRKTKNALNKNMMSM